MMDKVKSVKRSRKFITKYPLALLLVYPITSLLRWILHEQGCDLTATIFTLAVIAFASIYSYFLIVDWQTQKKENESLENYMSRVEENQLKVRKFRHDYINILLSLKEFMNKDDMAGLIEYFESEIIPMTSEIEGQNTDLSQLALLKIDAIKSIVAAKLIQAQEDDVRVIVEIPEEITQINMKTAVLVRILGIVLDNAVEASVMTENPRVSFAIFKHNEKHLLAIRNNCHMENLPTIKQMFTQGFTTKESGLGLGLSTLEEMIDKIPQAEMECTVADDNFTLLITIKDEGNAYD